MPSNDLIKAWIFCGLKSSVRAEDFRSEIMRKMGRKMKWIWAHLCILLIILSMFCRPAFAFLIEEKICASDGKRNKPNYFGGINGEGVSISGDFAVVGVTGAEPSGSYSGAAYIYRYDGERWSEQQKLAASNGAASDKFGTSVSISGTRAIIGAYYGDGNIANSGTAYIYSYNGKRWVEEKLMASDGDSYDHFGYSVAISGDFAIVGAFGAGDYPVNFGAAYIYGFDGTKWVEQQKLVPSDGYPGDQFGRKVSISGKYAIIGAPLNDDFGMMSGAAYIFHYDGTKWIEQQKLLPSVGEKGDRFGWAVSISDTNAIVTAYLGDGAAEDSGASYVYHFNGSKWIEQQKLYEIDGSTFDRYGFSTAISGNYLLVTSKTRWPAGGVYLYHYDGTSWHKADRYWRAGESVSLDGHRVIIGTPFDNNDCNGNYITGSAIIHNILEKNNPISNIPTIEGAIGKIIQDLSKIIMSKQDMKANMSNLKKVGQLIVEGKYNLAVNQLEVFITKIEKGIPHNDVMSSDGQKIIKLANSLTLLRQTIILQAESN